ncbi:hypothetical protein WICPIJ_001530 [Wickerhamomyces pijperi]|uniref:Uncharacterized protein n=1 Tax=Wickerhamomyces pijperi TaxID=599730 RepID=A0A9P8TQP9_WICPI|nr:hypothetical protein WICPIJ_001530 [Wickerhamomyces pijperi]
MTARNEEQNDEFTKEFFLGVFFSQPIQNQRDLWPLVILQDYTSEELFFSWKEEATKDMDCMRYPGDVGFDGLTPEQKFSQLSKMKLFHRSLQTHRNYPYTSDEPNNNEDAPALAKLLPFETDQSFNISNLSQLNSYSEQMMQVFQRSNKDNKMRKDNAKDFNIAYKSILHRLNHKSITTKETSILCLCLMYCQQRGLTRRYIDGSNVRSFHRMLQKLIEENDIAPIDAYSSAENLGIIRRCEGVLKSRVMNGLQEILLRRATVFRLNVAIITVQALQIFVLKSGLFVAVFWLVNIVNIVVLFCNRDQRKQSISGWRMLLEVVFQLVFLAAVVLFSIHSVDILTKFDWLGKIPLPEGSTAWEKIEARGICWAGIFIDLILSIWLLFFKGRLTESAFHPFVDLENYFD